MASEEASKYVKLNHTRLLRFKRKLDTTTDTNTTTNTDNNTTTNTDNNTTTNNTDNNTTTNNT